MADKNKKDEDLEDLDEDLDVTEDEAEDSGKDAKKYDKDAKPGKTVKASKPAKKKGRGIGQRMKKYGRDLKGEFKKIIWPTIPQTARSTLVTISMCIVVGIFIIAVDAGLGQVIGLLTGLKG